MKIKLDRNAIHAQAAGRIEAIFTTVFLLTGSATVESSDRELPITKSINRLVDILEVDGNLAPDVSAALAKQAAIERDYIVSVLGAGHDAESPLGRLMLAAELFLLPDDLITLSEASIMSGRSLSDLSNKIKRGQLRAYSDQTVSNPTHARRVRVSDVRALPAVRR